MIQIQFLVAHISAHRDSPLANRSHAASVNSAAQACTIQLIPLRAYCDGKAAEAVRRGA